MKCLKAKCPGEKCPDSEMFRGPNVLNIQNVLKFPVRGEMYWGRIYREEMSAEQSNTVQRKALTKKRSNAMHWEDEHSCAVGFFSVGWGKPETFGFDVIIYGIRGEKHNESCNIS